MRTLLSLATALMVLTGMQVYAADPGPPVETTPVRPAAVTKAIAAAQAMMLAQLAKQYPREQLVSRVENGLFGTVIAVSAYPQAYPGTGVMRQMIDGVTGVSYGVHAERSFADFARERGWLVKPPPADDLLRCFNTALFEGVAMLDDKPAPRVTTGAHGLRIEVVQRFMPSHSGTWLVVTVPPSGRESVEKKPLD